VPERLDRIEAGGAPGGEIAEPDILVIDSAARLAA